MKRLLAYSAIALVLSAGLIGRAFLYPGDTNTFRALGAYTADFIVVSLLGELCSWIMRRLRGRKSDSSARAVPLIENDGRGGVDLR